MDRNTALATLRRHQADLERLGVRHVALFGSLARGEARVDSDLDLLVDIDPAKPIGVFEYVGIIEYLQGLFPISVDVSNRATLKPALRPTAEQDALYAF